MEKELIAFMAERYGWKEEEIKEAESFEALGLDSLSLYALVTDCEDKFHVTIETDDMTQIDAPEKFIEYVTGRQK